MALSLRDYQQQAVDSIFSYFQTKSGSPLVIIPTAGGKSLVQAEFIKRALVTYPGTRICAVSHVSELIKQNAEELVMHYPEINMSFCSAKIGKKNLQGEVVFGTIQSIYKKAFDFPHAPDLLLIDEAHLLSPNANTMYRKFIDDLKKANPFLKIIGFTASAFRSDQGMLHEGDGRFFTDICHETTIIDLINRGYLTPIITPEKGLRTKMSTEGVGMRGGDFIASQLQKAVDHDPITIACVDEIIEHSIGRKKWLVFTAGVEHCEHVRDEIRKRGIVCEMVHGETPIAERSNIIEQFKNGDIQCVVNVAVMTTGLNIPAIDLLVFMRPLRSPVLYLQCGGRAMRLFPGKHDALLLDFGGVVEALGPIDSIKIKSKQKGDGEAPAKTCPECAHRCHAAALTCEACGYAFPEREISIQEGASTAAVLSTQIKAEWKKVSHVAYYRHQKEGKPDSMRVDYLCGYKSFREWICLNHGGKPREKACEWWRERMPGAVPNNVEEALQLAHNLRKPTEISIKKSGAYFEVLGARYESA